MTVSNGPLAQLAEQLTLNQKVVGSIPTWSTIENEAPPGLEGLYVFEKFPPDLKTGCKWVAEFFIKCQMNTFLPRMRAPQN